MNAPQLEKAIALGLGRAVVYLLDHDAGAFRTVILDACLHNKAYDPQVEGGRAAYLKDLIQASGDEAFFERALVDSLAHDADDWDLTQRFELAGLLAKEGSQDARFAMREAFRGKALSNSGIALTFIELDGIPGLLFIAGRIGEALKRDSGQWEDDYLLSVAYEICGREEVETAIKSSAESDGNVRAYLAAVAENRALRAGVSKRDLKTLTFKEVQSLMEGDGAAGTLHQWAQTASNADLALAAHHLLQETDAKKLKLYLAMFLNRHFPLGLERLLELVDWPDGPVPRHALGVLAKLKDERIRTLAFKLVEAESPLRVFAIDLLINNSHPGDHRVVEGWCDAEHDSGVINAFDRSVLKFFAEHPDAELEQRLLAKFYEREPCAHCRCAVVERMLAMNGLPDDLRRECEYDSYAETRALLRP
jgi:hypothetical protein